MSAVLGIIDDVFLECPTGSDFTDALWRCPKSGGVSVCPKSGGEGACPRALSRGGLGGIELCGCPKSGGGGGVRPRALSRGGVGVWSGGRTNAVLGTGNMQNHIV